MGPEEQRRWKSEVLDVVFEALSADTKLNNYLVFKGARVLNLRLGGAGRQSLDIDSNVSADFVERFSAIPEQRAFLEKQIARALRRHFEHSDPVRYALIGDVRVRPVPARGHPHGWTGFAVRMAVADQANARLRNLPTLVIDVAAPERLLEGSTASLRLGKYEVVAHTLERIAGEKLRAFLQSLPTHRAKLRRKGEGIRAKDIYDLARIAQQHPLEERKFWGQCMNEFAEACRTRLVDCEGLTTFEEALSETRQAFEDASMLRTCSPWPVWPGRRAA